jgi:1-acyl-sn-glycerol-3-phosphate acyltransferase
LTVSRFSRNKTSRLTRAWRLARVAAHFTHAAGVAGLGYPFMTVARRRRELQRWSAGLVRHLATNLTVHGEPPLHGARFLLVANHVSWLDIFAINAAVPTRFVAKSDVRRWPLVGWLCVKADTLFIERDRPRDIARIDALITEALRGDDGAGAGMGVFLEGTTTDGTQVLPFHSSLLRPAQQAGAQVIPVAIQYLRHDGSICTEAAYDGDKSAMDTLRLMLTQHKIHAHVYFLPSLVTDGVHRKELAHNARDAIVRTLNF